MVKRVIVVGVLGGVVLMAWTFVINAFWGFQARIDMKRMPAERHVYEMLKENVVDPGRYIVNPELTPEGRFPDGQPVFSVLYGGIGHEAAGGLMWVSLLVFFISPTIAAWMLAQTSERVRSSFSRKVLFVVAIGLMLALSSDLTRFGIGSYPVKDAIAFALNRLVVWTLVALVLAWRIRPEAAGASAQSTFSDR